MINKEKMVSQSPENDYELGKALLSILFCFE